MIFERLTLHNFGVFRGEHSIELAVTPDKPVILIGALNGSGKTTILEATQLALFGRAARGTNRGRTGYHEYLAQLINRDVDLETGAGVGLRFRHRHGGRDECFDVNRTWRKVGSTVKERVEVARDGSLDVDATDRWLEFVEQFLPVQLADLFLFDGERIETLADPETSGEFLRVGVHALLGLDLVDHLTRSLATLERRKRGSDASSRIAEGHLRDAEAEVQRLHERRRQLTEAQAEIRKDLDRLEGELRRCRRQLTKEGGELFSRRDHIQAEVDRAETALGTEQSRLREFAGGDAPLLLLKDLLREAQDLARSSDASRKAASIYQVLTQRDLRLLKILGTGRLGKAKRQEIERFLTTSREDWRRRATETVPPELGLVGPGVGMSNELGTTSALAKQLLKSFNDVKTRAELYRARKDSVPAEESLRVYLDQEVRIQGQQLQAQARLTLLGEEFAKVGRELDRAATRVQKCAEELHRASIDHEDERRIIKYAGVATETLAKFRQAVVLRNVDRLESLITEVFQTLLHKQDCLVKIVKIDPQTFRLELRDSRQTVLDPLTLSAGERQLLAVAIVWALARASGRALPTMIDTPLGRLDSQHRSNLVNRYFPKASHQVILLSTDEEVNGQYYTQLFPKVGREYRIQFNEETRSSGIERGYFEQPARAVA